MNIVGVIFTLLLIGLGLTLMVPILTFGVVLIVMFSCFFIWLLPILIIANSDKVTGGEKLAWILAIVFLSWFACVFYFLLAPIKDRPRPSEYRYY